MPVNVTRQVFQVVPDDDNPSSSIPMGIGLMKGDILVYRGEGDVVRLPVGTNGQVLTADSSAELGVKWADPVV